MQSARKNNNDNNKKGSYINMCFIKLLNFKTIEP